MGEPRQRKYTEKVLFYIRNMIFANFKAAIVYGGNMPDIMESLHVDARYIDAIYRYL